MCLPLAQASSSSGLALLTCAVRWMSWKLTLPAPAPLPVGAEPSFEAPHEKLSTSIVLGCLLSVDSPLMVSISSNWSHAMTMLSSFNKPPEAHLQASRLLVADADYQVQR